MFLHAFSIIFFRSCYQRSFIIFHSRGTREGRTGGAAAEIGAGGNKSDRILFYNHLRLRANIFRWNSKSFRRSGRCHGTEPHSALSGAAINITFHSFTAAESQSGRSRNSCGARTCTNCLVINSIKYSDENCFTSTSVSFVLFRAGIVRTRRHTKATLIAVKNWIFTENFIIDNNKKKDFFGVHEKLKFRAGNSMDITDFIRRRDCAQV